MSRKKEFIIYVVLSTIGLGLNELLLYICVDVIYVNSAFLMGLYGERLAEIIAKVFATGVVMIYNFVSRKLILEKKS